MAIGAQKKLTVVLSADVADFQKKLSIAQKTLQSTARSMIAIGQNLAFSIGAPLAGISVALVKLAGDFEKAGNNIATQTQLSRGEVDKLEKSVAKLTSTLEIDVSQIDAMKGGLAVAGAGFRDAAQVTETLTKAAQLNSLGLGEMDTIARALTATMTAFAPQGVNAAEAANAFLLAVQEGGFPAEQWAGVVARLGSVAITSGVSLNELTAAVAVYTRVTGDADEATTGITRLLGDLANASEKAKKVWGEIFKNKGGILEARRLVSQDMIGFFQQLAQAMLKMPIEELQEVAATLFDNERAARGFMNVFAAQGPEVIATMRRISENTLALPKALNEIKNSWDRIFKVMIARSSDLGKAIGEEIMPAIKGITLQLAAWTASLAPLLAANAKLIFQMAAITVGVIAAYVAIGVLGLAVATVMGFFNALFAAVTTVLGAFVSVGAGITGLIATMGGLSGAAISVVGAFGNLAYVTLPALLATLGSLATGLAATAAGCLVVLGAFVLMSDSTVEAAKQSASTWVKVYAIAVQSIRQLFVLLGIFIRDEVIDTLKQMRVPFDDLKKFLQKWGIEQRENTSFDLLFDGMINSFEKGKAEAINRVSQGFGDIQKLAEQAIFGNAPKEFKFPALEMPSLKIIVPPEEVAKLKQLSSGTQNLTEDLKGLKAVGTIELFDPATMTFSLPDEEIAKLQQMSTDTEALGADLQELAGLKIQVFDVDTKEFRDATIGELKQIQAEAANLVPIEPGLFTFSEVGKSIDKFKADFLRLEPMIAGFQAQVQESIGKVDFGKIGLPVDQEGLKKAATEFEKITEKITDTSFALAKLRGGWTDFEMETIEGSIEIQKAGAELIKLGVISEAQLKKMLEGYQFLRKELDRDTRFKSTMKDMEEVVRGANEELAAMTDGLTDVQRETQKMLEAFEQIDTSDFTKEQIAALQKLKLELFDARIQIEQMADAIEVDFAGAFFSAIDQVTTGILQGTQDWRHYLEIFQNIGVGILTDVFTDFLKQKIKFSKHFIHNFLVDLPNSVQGTVDALKATSDVLQELSDASVEELIKDAALKNAKDASAVLREISDEKLWEILKRDPASIKEAAGGVAPTKGPAAAAAASGSLLTDVVEGVKVIWDKLTGSSQELTSSLEGLDPAIEAAAAAVNDYVYDLSKAAEPLTDLSTSVLEQYYEDIKASNAALEEVLRSGSKKVISVTAEYYGGIEQAVEPPSSLFAAAARLRDFFTKDLVGWMEGVVAKVKGAFDTVIDFSWFDGLSASLSSALQSAKKFLSVDLPAWFSGVAQSAGEMASTVFDFAWLSDIGSTLTRAYKSARKFLTVDLSEWFDGVVNSAQEMAATVLDFSWLKDVSSALRGAYDAAAEFLTVDLVGWFRSAWKSAREIAATVLDFSWLDDVTGALRRAASAAADFVAVDLVGWFKQAGAALKKMMASDEIDTSWMKDLAKGLSDAAKAAYDFIKTKLSQWFNQAAAAAKSVAGTVLDFAWFDDLKQALGDAAAAAGSFISVDVVKWFQGALQGAQKAAGAVLDFSWLEEVGGALRGAYGAAQRFLSVDLAGWFRSVWRSAREVAASALDFSWLDPVTGALQGAARAAMDFVQVDLVAWFGRALDAVQELGAEAVDFSWLKPLMGQLEAAGSAAAEFIRVDLVGWFRGAGEAIRKLMSQEFDVGWLQELGTQFLDAGRAAAEFLRVDLVGWFQKTFEAARAAAASSLDFSWLEEIGTSLSSMAGKLGDFFGELLDLDAMADGLQTICAKVYHFFAELLDLEGLTAGLSSVVDQVKDFFVGLFTASAPAEKLDTSVLEEFYKALVAETQQLEARLDSRKVISIYSDFYSDFEEAAKPPAGLGERAVSGLQSFFTGLMDGIQNGLASLWASLDFSFLGDAASSVGGWISSLWDSLDFSFLGDLAGQVGPWVQELWDSLDFSFIGRVADQVGVWTGQLRDWLDQVGQMIGSFLQQLFSLGAEGISIKVNTAEVDGYARTVENAWDAIADRTFTTFKGMNNEIDIFSVETLDSFRQLTDRVTLMLDQMMNPSEGKFDKAIKILGYVKTGLSIVASAYSGLSAGLSTGATADVGAVSPESAGYTNTTGWEPLQTGGIVKKPTRAMIGEAGPEAVVPLSKLSDMMTPAAAQETTVIVNSPHPATVKKQETPDERRIEVIIDDAIAKSIRTGGKASQAMERSFGVRRQGGSR